LSERLAIDGKPAVDWARGVLAELATLDNLTIMPRTTIFGVAVDRRGAKNVFGFAIGLTVCMDILAAGPITGASMNPARSFGPAIIGGYWQMHSAYWLGPIIGALLAAIIYETFLLPEDQKVRGST
jgi:glycerol uptake facilitator-like aquaporin